MQALQVLSEVQHRNVKLWAAGDRLRFSPASALTPELVEGLRENKEYILEHLKRREEIRQDTSPRIGAVGEVLELARARFGTVEDPVTPPALPGRDPMVGRHTDKARFFKGNWREAWPRDFKVYEGEAGREQ